MPSARQRSWPGRRVGVTASAAARASGKGRLSRVTGRKGWEKSAGGPGEGHGPEEREPGACGTGALGPDSRSCREIGARGVCARVRVSGRAGWRRPAEAGAEDVVTGLRSPSRDFPASGVRVSDPSAAASFSPSSPHPPHPPFHFSSLGCPVRQGGWRNVLQWSVQRRGRWSVAPPDSAPRFGPSGGCSQWSGRPRRPVRCPYCGRHGAWPDWTWTGMKARGQGNT